MQKKSFDVNREVLLELIALVLIVMVVMEVKLHLPHHITLSMESQFVSISDTGQLPDGLSPPMLLYLQLHQEPVISANTDIKLAKTLNDAINGYTN